MSYIGSKDFLVEVARGNVAGHSLVHKFGKNPAVPNASWEFVTPLGQTAHALSAATTVRIKSGGDANDTAAGTHAREVTVEGIVATTFAEESEAIATAGTSASSSTTKSFWRVHRAWVSAVGAYGNANDADITIENTAGTVDILTLLDDEGQSQEAIWTVPAGKTAYLISAHITVDGSKAADIRIYTRHDIDDTSAPMPSKRVKKFFDGVLGGYTYRPRAPDITIPAKADIWVEAFGGGAQTEVSADLELLVVDD